MQRLQIEKAEEIYALYPRKIGKKAALKAISKAISEVTKNAALWSQENGKYVDGASWLKERVTVFRDSPAGQHHGLFDGYHPPHPSTWFNQGRYEDSPDEWYVESAEAIKHERLLGCQGIRR